ncbi:vacuolar protein sorting-associated protein 35-domain-containing protein [Earliella scabrosa]|nr:vacuolar protein sorting-associated protein 35-domain-containing protein [Earliella scabrosa]
MTTVPPPIGEGMLLRESESLTTVKIEVQQMKRHLEVDHLIDALKSTSLALDKLRTSSFSLKQYYEICMAVFDTLRDLFNYLYDAQVQNQHHLAYLYELVQHAGNIIRPLYLMMTATSVYMSTPRTPVKDLMQDMLEMARGVLHPIRAPFLRHYLSGQTRDHLPVMDDAGNIGSIKFVLTNFMEMNKRCVRLPHQGHSRDLEKREVERRELRILVGTNLVRLSQLDGVKLHMYQKNILPSILQQTVICKDVTAQEYLMEVGIQLFTDEFHLYTVGSLLCPTAQLQPKLNIKQIVIPLFDRLAACAVLKAETDDPKETKPSEETTALRLAEKVKRVCRRNPTSSTTQSAPGITNVWGSASRSPVTAKKPQPATSTTNATTENGDAEKGEMGERRMLSWSGNDFRALVVPFAEGLSRS